MKQYFSNEVLHILKKKKKYWNLTQYITQLTRKFRSMDNKLTMYQKQYFKIKRKRSL